MKSWHKYVHNRQGSKRKTLKKKMITLFLFSSVNYDPCNPDIRKGYLYVRFKDNTDRFINTTVFTGNICGVCIYTAEFFTLPPIFLKTKSKT